MDKTKDRKADGAPLMALALDCNPAALRETETKQENQL